MAVLRARRGFHTRNNDNNKDGKKVNLPYIKGTTDKIAKILKRGNIKVSFPPPNTIKKMLDRVKNVTNPKQQKGVYSIRYS